MRMNQIAVLFMKTEFYYMLYDALTRRFISFAKVLTPRSMHLQNTLVTIDGNHFFKLDRSSYSIKSIQITESLLSEIGFKKVHGSRIFLSVPNTQVVFIFLFSSGGCVEILQEGQAFFYLAPNRKGPDYFDKISVKTIDQIQRAVLRRENKAITLPLLDTELNKKTLSDELKKHLGSEYDLQIGPNNGSFIDGDNSRPDYAFLCLRAKDPNTVVSEIDLNCFHSKGCSVTIALAGKKFRYRYGMSFQEAYDLHPQLHQILCQEESRVRDICHIINVAIKMSLTC